MSEQEQFDQFEAWWKTLNIYDPTLKALCGSAWMQAIRSTSVTTAAGCENDPWVTQDRVPARVGIDEYRYASWTHEPDRWRPVNESGGWNDSAKHGWVDDKGDTLLLRCRASKLPEGCATEVTDRRGVVLVPGQKVFVLQTDKTRIATVVEVTEKRSSNGWWVDVDFGSGPEGIPSDILEVCNAPATPSSTEAILGDPVGGVTMQKAEDPDEWVVLDPVKYADHVPRVGIDEFSTGNGAWITQEPGHGNNTVAYWKASEDMIHRCRRRDLPKVEQAQLDVIGTLSFDPATGEYSRTPQPQKTRVRLWIEGPTKMVMCRDKAPYGDWQELHHDSEGFYVEQGQ